MSRFLKNTRVWIAMIVIFTTLGNTQETQESAATNFADCYVCNGNHYRGKANITESGRTCQHWDVNTPHKVKKMPGSQLFENYCRNADGAEKPWCYTTDPKIKQEYCDINRCTNDDGSVYMPDSKYTTDCSSGKGGSYRGTISTTILGKNCAKWESNQRQENSFTDSKYPCSGLQENYCRNPLSNRKAPWCYTTKEKVKWEYCSIPFCGENQKRITVQPQTPVECGESPVQPTFTNQNFEIKDGEIVRKVLGAFPRIIGGNTVDLGTWPWMVQIKKGSMQRGYHHCGGTLIHKYWVLSAAHCLGKTPKAYFLSAGKHYVRSEFNTQIRRVAQLWIHHDYNAGGLQNDVGLLLVEKPFTFSKTIKPACLPKPEYVVPDGTFCIAVGWGRTFDPNWTKELKQAVLKVKKCDNVYFICTGGKDATANVCRGDSGGPLLCLENKKWVVEGIASHTYGCKEKNNHAGFSRVSKYVDWINQKIEKFTPVDTQD